MSLNRIKAGEAYVEGTLDRTKLDRGLQMAQRRFRATARAIGSLGGRLTAYGGGVLAAFTPAISAASDLQETMGKFNVVFGKNSAAVKEWGDDFAKTVGRSKQDVAGFLSSTQDLLVPLGFEDGAATEMSKQLTQLTVDLASFNNKAEPDVLRDLHAALTGSGEVMKKYGVIVSQAAVNQELLAQSLDPKTATEAQKVMARLNIIMRGTTAAQGDAERTSDSFANQMKRLKAELKDTAAEIGTKLLPVVTQWVSKASAVAAAVGGWAAENGELVTTVAKVAAGVAAVGISLTAIAAPAAVAAAALSGVSSALALATSATTLTFAPVAIGIGMVGIAALSATGQIDALNAAIGRLTADTGGGSAKALQAELADAAATSASPEEFAQRKQKMKDQVDGELAILKEGLAKQKKLLEENKAARDKPIFDPTSAVGGATGIMSSMARNAAEKVGKDFANGGTVQEISGNIARLEAQIQRLEQFDSQLGGAVFSQAPTVAEGPSMEEISLKFETSIAAALRDAQANGSDPVASEVDNTEERRAQAIARAQDEAAEARIKAELKGAEQAAALMELRKQQELRRLQEEGLLNQELLDAINDKYEALEELQGNSTVGVAAVAERVSGGGTFNGRLASMQFTNFGNDLPKRQLDELKKIAETNEEIRDEQRRQQGGIFIGG